MRTNFFSRIFCDRTRDNGFELKLVIFRLDIRKNFFYSEGIEKLEQVSQLNCGFPIPGNIQGEAGLVSEQPGHIEDVSDHCRSCWTRWPLKAPSNQKYSIILWFFSSESVFIFSARADISGERMSDWWTSGEDSRVYQTAALNWSVVGLS